MHRYPCNACSILPYCQGEYEMKQIENYIEEYLKGGMKQTAVSFVKYLRDNNVTFYKDTCNCWKDKIYYWVKIGEDCVCFIAIADPDEPDNLWTVWSDESKMYDDPSVEKEIKTVAWNYVDRCGNCGSCGGGKQKIIFGKVFTRVCGCTFRVDNADKNDLPFLKMMVELRIKEISNSGI